jgi:hypothetical protein
MCTLNRALVSATLAAARGVVFAPATATAESAGRLDADPMLLGFAEPRLGTARGRR